MSKNIKKKKNKSEKKISHERNKLEEKSKVENKERKLKKFQIKLFSEGSITQLPDSQRIFGCLMKELNQAAIIDTSNDIDSSGDNWTEEDVTNFVNRVYGDCEESKQVTCMISGVVPAGYVPTPKAYLMKKIEEKIIPTNQTVIIAHREEENRKFRREIQKWSQEEEVEDDGRIYGEEVLKEMEREREERKKKKLQNILSNRMKIDANEKVINNISPKTIYETLKKMDFIEKKELSQLLSRIKNYPMPKKKSTGLGADELKSYKYLTGHQTYLQKISIESDAKNIPGLPNKLFSLPIVELRNENTKVNKEVKVNRDFCFYVVIEEDTILAKYLAKLAKLIKSEEKYFFLGPKSSQGYNRYRLLGVSEEKYLEKPGQGIYLNMGMLLPKEDMINWKESDISVFTSNRRAYDISDSTDKVISFIDTGSVIAISESSKQAKQIGKCIKNKYNVLYPNAIIFGNSYLEPLEV